MSDLLLLGGVALCALSVIVAVIQLMQTQAPRGAAILLVFGIAAIAAAAWLAPEPVALTDLAGAWARLSASGQPAQP